MYQLFLHRLLAIINQANCSETQKPPKNKIIVWIISTWQLQNNVLDKRILQKNVKAGTNNSVSKGQVVRCSVPPAF